MIETGFLVINWLQVIN